MRIVVLFAAGLFLFTGCESPPPDSSAPSGQAVVDSAVAAHGGAVLDHAVVSFLFRGDEYTLRHDEGQFHYRRTYRDSTGRTVVDGVTNDSTYRRVNGEPVPLTPDEKSAVETKVNSVVYFALLPEPLEDPAVQPRYTGTDTIDGVPYHRVRVTFRKKGGGKDWEDTYVYWFQTDTYEMKYFSYAFGLAPSDTDTGTRFREAYNVRRIQGVRVADYMNYTSDTLSVDHIDRYPDLWARDALELVSRVEIDSVRIRGLSSES